MKLNKKMLPMALVATGLLASPSSVLAKKKGMGKMIKCNGVATKWSAGCKAGDHECAGKNETDFGKDDWIKMPAKECKAVKAALAKKSIKNYVIKIRNSAVKHSDKF